MLQKFIFLAALSSLLTACASTFQGPGHFRSDGGRFHTQKSSRQLHSPSQRSQTLALSWPVKRVRLTQPYRPHRNRSHQGVDLGGSKGSAILAAHEGRVIYTGSGFTGYGNMVMIEWDSNWATLYAHLNHIDVKEGQWVRQGQVIGGMGRTGRATGVHLHFELIRNKQPVDPLNYLQQSETLAGQ